MSRASKVAEDIALIALFGAAGIVLFGADKYYILVLSLTGIGAIAATGLNILVGLSGQISLGHAAFYALGAYTVGLLTTGLALDFWLALPAAGLLTAAAGLLLSIPALRAEGPYLAMITIAFGFIVEQGLVEWKPLTGGWDGISGIDMPSFFGVEVRERGFAYLVLAALTLTLLFFRQLKAGPWGMAMQAVRDAPAAAQAVGLDVLRVRAVAFALSAGLTGIAGGFFAPLNSFISPDSFPFTQSIAFLLIVMIGGSSAVSGPVYGALIVVLAPEIFSWLAQYRVLAMGVLFLLVLLIAPSGIAGLVAAMARRLANFKPPAASPSAASVLPNVQIPINPDRRATLTVNNLDVRFSGVHAVRSLSFSARAGKITSLVGPNGAGKSTVINLICGFYTPQGGSIQLGERDITALSPHGRARLGVARTFQTAQLFWGLTVAANVAIAATKGRLRLRDFILRGRFSGQSGAPAGVLDFVGYSRSPAAEASALPHVDRRLVEIARALELKPSVLALDEPAAGLDATDKHRLGEVLKEVAESGVAVLLIEHDMELVMSISDHVVVLDAGSKIAEGTPAEILANEAVKKAYLGEGPKAHPSRRPQKSPRGEPLLKATAVEAGYGANLVLRGISFDVKHGETVAILGANGAGKTTLLRSLAGLNDAKAGEILFAGRDITRAAAEQRSEAGLVLVPEGRQIFPELSVIDNLLLGGINRPRADALQAMDEFLNRFPKLADRRHQRAGLLSGGEQQMLAIARGLMARPKILMLDEPSLGLAPLIVEEVYSWLSTLHQQSMTILIADQLAPLALSISSRAYVLQGGRVLYEGESAQLASDPALSRAYLGEAATLSGK